MSKPKWMLDDPPDEKADVGQTVANEIECEIVPMKPRDGKPKVIDFDYASLERQVFNLIIDKSKVVHENKTSPTGRIFVEKAKTPPTRKDRILAKLSNEVSAILFGMIVTGQPRHHMNIAHRVDDLLARLGMHEMQFKVHFTESNQPYVEFDIEHWLAEYDDGSVEI